MNVEPRFWMVYNVTTGGLPTVKHSFLGVARRAAEQMARKYPGNKFVVLGTVCGAYVAPPQPVVPELQTIEYAHPRSLGMPPPWLY